ncbi:unnamed protein product [Cuscuta epithymum]|uniref:Late embryogenesis abundant protein LEA-2 subgroup domain-containing protein n=1 Tax=Cuscuta epithymum TaxID=186058 RepID=A0AAV0G0I0_9ASTE|nr:unnamed protein product [Cuscuta epithymum]
MMTTATPPQSPGFVKEEQEQVRPLAPAAASGYSHRMDDAETGRLAAKDRRIRKCVMCGGCCCATTLIIILVVIILALTVFRVKDPTIKTDSIRIDGLSSLMNTNSILNPNVNLTLSAGISVKNPNRASFRFDEATTSLIYDGRVVGEAKSPPGNARARRTLTMNVTVNVLVQNLASASRLPRDLLAGKMPVALSTKIHGKAKVVIIKKSVTVRMNCTMSFDLSSQNIEDLDCSKKVSL